MTSEVSSSNVSNSEAQRGLYYPFPGGKPGVTLTSSCSSTSESMADGSASCSSSTSSPSSMEKGQSGSPICKNCLTSTTPLWRRDENGALLCNACGLFLKLHGRPRPISLKTDVIKSRNRKGTHHHQHQQSDSVVEKQHTRTHSDEKKRKLPVQPVLKKQRVVEDNESKDICSAANTLEILMSGDSMKPKIEPKLPPSQANTQLPHLSTLLGDVRSQSNPPVSLVDQPMETSKSLHFEPKNKPYIHESIPVSTSSSTSSLVRGNSISQRYNSPPRAQTPPAGSAQRVSTLPAPVNVPLPFNEPQEKLPLNTVLQNEEDVIKLKTRINELELVTDLYKRHIFELDEKCKTLQCEIQSLRN